MLPLAVLAWESDLNLRGAIEQRYVTDFAVHQFLTGVTGSVGANAANPFSTYQLDVSGGYFGSYQLTTGASESTSPHQVSGQVQGSATWQTSPLTRLSFRVGGGISSELGSTLEADPTILDGFAGNRIQYFTSHDLGFNASISPRTTLSFGAGYTQTGALVVAGTEPAGIDTHSIRNSVATTFDATAVDQLSAELGARYTRYAHAIIDADLQRGHVDSYAGTLIVQEAHEFSQNLRGSAGAGLTAAMWFGSGLAEATPPVPPTSGAGVFPEGRAQMAYTGRNYDASWGYTLTFSPLGSRIGDGQSHAAWANATVSPLRGRLLRDFRIRAVGRFSYGITSLTEQASGGDVHVWLAGGGAGVECPLAPMLALTSGLHAELRHLAVDTGAPAGATATTSVRVTAIVGIAGVLSMHPAAPAAAQQTAE